MSNLKRAAALTATCLFVSLVQAGCGPQKQVAGIGDFNVDTSNGNLSASVELTLFRTDTSLTLPVPKLQNAYLQFGPSPDGKGSTLAFFTPFSSIAAAVGGSLPQQGLPDGRPLVGTTAASLPAFDLTIQNLTLRFYVSGDVFGIFIPLPLPSFSGSIEVPIQDARGYVVAYGCAIPPGSKPGTGGLLVWFPVVANLGSFFFHNFSLFS